MNDGWESDDFYGETLHLAGVVRARLIFGRRNEYWGYVPLANGEQREACFRSRREAREWSEKQLAEEK